jgi:hypothetical protein
MLVMPWWALIAFAAFGLVSIGGVLVSIADRTPVWEICLDVVGDVFLLALALAYWLPFVASAIRPFAVILLGVTVASQILEVHRDFVASTASTREKSIALALLVVVSAPLYVWAVSYTIASRMNT